MLGEGMNPSQHYKISLFVSFSASFKAASWPTYLSMSCETAFKAAKKYIKNQTFGIQG